VRRAVERTFQATLGSTRMTRERAQELADDVLRGAEESAARAGRGVRGARVKPREAAAGVGDRVRDAIHDLRLMTGEDVKDLRVEVQRLRRRVDVLERQMKGATPRARAGSAKRATSRAAPSKRAGSKASTAKGAAASRGQRGGGSRSGGKRP
jgi:polyhydroxyalkanoate synthesis regulator phasin